LEHGLRLHRSFVVRRLGAIPAVLRAPPGLHAEQRAELDAPFGVVLDVDAPRAVQELEQREVVQRANLGERVVVAQGRCEIAVSGHPLPSTETGAPRPLPRARGARDLGSYRPFLELKSRARSA